MVIPAAPPIVHWIPKRSMYPACRYAGIVRQSETRKLNHPADPVAEEITCQRCLKVLEKEKKKYG